MLILCFFILVMRTTVLQRGLTAGMAGRGTRVGGAEPSEQEVLGVMMRGHDSMMAVLTARERALQVRPCS